MDRQTDRHADRNTSHPYWGQGNEPDELLQWLCIDNSTINIGLGIIITSINDTKVTGGTVAQRVERWTCDQQVVGSNLTRGVTTAGKLFTPMCLRHQAV